MSQINDALKKAKQAQVNAPARKTAPQLRSPEMDHPSRPGSPLMLPMVLVVVGLVGAAVVWVAMSGRKPNTRDVEATAVVNSSSAAAKVDQPTVPPVSAAESALPAPIPDAVQVTETKRAIAAPPVATPPPAPALPKLDGIFFNPAKPTAILNGKLVSPGSRIGEFSVLAISQTGITLVGGGQTNVLSLSE